MFVNKTRRKTMIYTKPEVAKLDSAVKVIQGTQGKPSTLYADANPRLSNAATPMAYEADE